MKNYWHNVTQCLKKHHINITIMTELKKGLVSITHITPTWLLKYDCFVSEISWLSVYRQTDELFIDVRLLQKQTWSGILNEWHGFRDYEVLLPTGYDAIFHDGFWKSDHDFLMAFHSNFISGMQGFRDSEVLLLTGNDVIVISLLGGVSHRFCYQVGIKTSQSRKPFITDKTLLWITIS